VYHPFGGGSSSSSIVAAESRNKKKTVAVFTDFNPNLFVVLYSEKKI
jgi:hypothetical protein